MKNTKNILFVNKNSQRGASVLEVIFAIGLVVAVTPFIYNQISEMTHVIHDVSVANKITSTRDAVMNFMRVNQPDFTEESNEIPADTLNGIAPEAVKGMVYQISVGNSTIKNLETYLLFNIDDSKYRASSIAKYIGGDAAVVGDDNRAYAKDWAVQLPDSWSDVLESGGNHLVYRITRDFGGDDKTLYLHRSNLGEGDHLNRMERDLLMNNYDMVNVGNFKVNNLSMNTVNSNRIKATDVIQASNIQFTKGANINGGTLGFEVLTGMGAYGLQGGITANELSCEISSGTRCDLNVNGVESHSFTVNNGGLIASGTNTLVNIKGFDLNGNLWSPDIEVDVIQINPGLKLFVTDELSHLAFLKLVDWKYSMVSGELPVGPVLTQVLLNINNSANAISLENNVFFTTGDIDETEWHCILGKDCMENCENLCMN